MTAEGRLWNTWMAMRARTWGVYPNGTLMPVRWQDLPARHLYALVVLASFPGRGTS